MSTATFFAPPPQQTQPVHWPAVAPKDEAALIGSRRDGWFTESVAAGGYEEWLAGEFVLMTVRLDICHARASKIREYEALRAALVWTEDRALDAALLGERLARKPASIIRKLRGTLHGCLYLVEQWGWLARVLDAKGEWNEAQTASALDLLGVALELREGRTRLDPAPGVDRLAHLRAVCRAECAELTQRAEALVPIDAQLRAAAESGIGLLNNPALKAQQREERQCVQRLHWIAAELARVRGHDTPEAVAAPPKSPEPPSGVPLTPPPVSPPFRETPSSSKPSIHENRRARRARMKMAKSRG